MARCSKSGGTRVTPPREHSRWGRVFLNNRYHDPTLGSFVSVDPLVASTGEPYIYASGKPATLSDPSGLCPFSGCWEAFDAYLRGLRVASDYRQGLEELEPGAPLPLHRVIGHAEASAAVSLAFNNPIGISGVKVESRVEPRPEIHPHYEDSGRAEFTLGIDWDFCVFLCVPDFGLSSDGPYVRLGVGVGLEAPNLEIKGSAPKCGSRETVAAAAGALGVPRTSFEFGYGAGASRPTGSSARTVRTGPSASAALDPGAGVGGGASVGSGGTRYKAISVSVGIAHEATLC